MTAQLPDYVPTEGLVTWQSFQGNFEDASGNGNHGSSATPPSFEYDSFWNEEVAFFDDVDDELVVPAPAQLGVDNQISFALWVNPTEDTHGQVASMDAGRFSFYLSDLGQNFDALSSTNWASETIFCGLDNVPYPEAAGWQHFAVVIASESLSVFHNGVQINQIDCGGQTSFDTDIVYGFRHMNSTHDYHWGGHMAHAGVWNRTLSSEEVLQLYLTSLPAQGCLDEMACNFNLEANVDDASCEYGCLNCGPGTIWDDQVGLCVPSELNPAEGCHELVEAQFGICFGDTMVIAQLDSAASTWGVDGDVELNSQSEFVAWGNGTILMTEESGREGGAIQMDGEDDRVSLTLPEGWGMGSWTIQFTCAIEDLGEENVVDGYHYMLGHALTYQNGDVGIKFGTDPETGGVRFSFSDDGDVGMAVEFANSETFDFSAWHHYAASFDRENNVFKVFLDGDMLVSESIPQNLGNLESGLEASLGAYYYSPANEVKHHCPGLFGDVSFHADVLSAEEILSGIQQCTWNMGSEGFLWGVDPASGEYEALTHDSEVTTVGGSVVMGAGLCQSSCIVQTEFVVVGTECDEHCGEGTEWDAVSHTCVVANPSDTDFDGCVSMTDLLDLLTVFGTCAEEEPEEDPEVAEWFCGDPLEYQGYDYETVQIGEQCWFAENLRAENYRNGDEIPAGLSDEEWDGSSMGATAVYGEDSGCEDYAPDFDACSSGESLVAYGRLYNWHAVNDPRQLCPSGWSVSKDSDWISLELALGMDEEEVLNTGWRGTDQGVKMKATFGWQNGGYGTDDVGFGAQPGGQRTNGWFNQGGADGYWWCSESPGGGAFTRHLSQEFDAVGRGDTDNLHHGLSVRCIQDSE